ncbi:MAG: prolipoprotein diacylglyceryl transferase [Desulfovibrio sp.]
MIAFPHIDPVAISLGPLAVRWYGLMYVFGFAAAWWLGRMQTKRPNSPVTTEQFEDLLTWIIAGVILGGRVGYVLFYQLDYFLEKPLKIFAVWEGGMSFHGGLLGVTTVVILFALRHKIPLLSMGDFIAPLAPPGLFFGRMGNFMNQELWGRVTDAPWGVVFPAALPVGVPRHPSQLYEGVLEGLVLFVVLWTVALKTEKKGLVLGLFFTGYGLARFTVEFFRQPDAQLGFLAFNWLTMGQILSFPMILLGVLLMRRSCCSSCDL